eukprot:jgi/Undpi1/3314/HiC_scaffold_15.g06688.m1
MTRSRTCTANNIWARFLLIYLYAVSDEDYDDDDTEDFISIEDATGISTSEYGVLVGYGFTLSYVLSGLVMGRAADICNRKLILFYSALVWNFATVCIGLSSNFVQLLLSQILLGMAESSLVPASFSLIADYFPAESLAQANGIIVAGVYLGNGLSSLSIVMAEEFGWRATAYSVATIGFVLALIVLFTVKESVRAPAATLTYTAGRNQGEPDADGDRNLTVRQSLSHFLGEPLFILMIFGGMFRFMGGSIVVSYLPDFYSQMYPDYNTIYSYLNASVVSFGGALSSYLGGLAADRWEKAGEKRARMYIAAIGALLGTPAFFLVIVVPSFYASMFFLLVEFLFAECWHGPVLSVLQKHLPPRARGVGFGCYSLFTMSAGSLMSYAIGLVLEDYTSDYAIKVTLILSVCGTYLASAIFHLLASLFMPKLDASKGSETQRLLPPREDGSPNAGSDRANSRPNANGTARSTSGSRETVH